MSLLKKLFGGAPAIATPHPGLAALAGTGADELAAAVAGLSEDKEETDEATVARGLENHDELARAAAIVADAGRVVGGVAHIRIPPQARLEMMGRTFVVTHVSRTAVSLAVDSIPADFTTGRNVKIFTGLFTVQKITPQANGFRAVLVPANTRTKINPKPLPRR